jgi:hypothetical protein
MILFIIIIFLIKQSTFRCTQLALSKFKKETHKKQKKHFGQYWWLVIISEPYVSNLGTWTVAFFLPFQVPWKASKLCRFTPFPPETSIFLILQFSFGIFYSPTSPMGLFSLINLLMLLLSRKDFKTQFSFSPAKL